MDISAVRPTDPRTPLPQPSSVPPSSNASTTARLEQRPSGDLYIRPARMDALHSAVIAFAGSTALAAVWTLIEPKAFQPEDSEVFRKTVQRSAMSCAIAISASMDPHMHDAFASRWQFEPNLTPVQVNRVRTYSLVAGALALAASYAGARLGAAAGTCFKLA